METSKYSTYKDFEWAVKLNRYSLELIGLWPKSNQTTRENLICNIRLFFVILAVGHFFLIPSLYSVIRIYKNINLLIDNLQYTVPAITCILRISIFWWKKKGLAQLLGMMEKDWRKSKTPREEIIMTKRAQIARLINTAAYSLTGVGFTLIIAMPAYGISFRYVTNITDPGRLLPLQTYYVYDVTKSPQYELTFVSQAIAIFLCTLPYTGIDNFLSLLIFHISGQLDILANRLMDLNENLNFTNIVKSCVMDHVRLLRAIAIVEDAFNILLLALFLYFGFLIVCYGFLIINFLEDKNRDLFSGLTYIIIIITNLIGHMCIYCTVGEILVAQCDQIHYATYCSKWYTVQSRHARNIILLMVRTNKPLYLTAGKIFPLTMVTFCNMLKTSAGYVSILLAMKN